METNLYETDFYAWTQRQAELMRERHFEELDVENVTEELEAMGRSEKRQLVDRLAVLIAHLLKWQYQPQERQYRANSWLNTIEEQRERISDHLRENPSLKARLDEYFQNGYKYGVLKASKETGIEKKKFPADCPYTLKQVLDVEFLPK